MYPRGKVQVSSEVSFPRPRDPKFIGKPHRDLIDLKRSLISPPHSTPVFILYLSTTVDYSNVPRRTLRQAAESRKGLPNLHCYVELQRYVTTRMYSAVLLLLLLLCCVKLKLCTL